MTSPLNPTTGWSRWKKLQSLSLTQIAEFCRCPRLFFYHVGCWLTEPVAHPALTFGTSIGAGLAELSSGTDSDRLERAVAKFNEAWADGDSLGDDKRNSYNAIQIFRHYMEQTSPGNGLYEIVKPPQGQLQSGHGISPWEVPFAFYLGDLPIPIIGSVDGLLRDKQTGLLWAREIKTTTEWSHSFLADNFRRNPQTTGYAWSLNHQSIEVAGTVLELVFVPPPGKTVRAKPKYDVTTHTIPLERTHIPRFEQWLLNKCHEILERERRMFFDEDWSACAGYSQFGKATFPCRYELLCNSDDWTSLAGMFVERQHQPFDLTNLTIAGKEMSS